MTSSATIGERQRPPMFAPTLTKQCVGFMIGSALFALATAPALSDTLSAHVANLLCFVGAWFFTAAGLVQLFLSGSVSTAVPYPPGRTVRPEWLAASTQTFGTILFNVSTTAALQADSPAGEERFVWRPDAAGSVAFLVSGIVSLVACVHSARRGGVDPRGWWSVVINLLGCIAFALSAVGAYILPGGEAVNFALAGGGTFVGAICFFAASLIALPQWSRSGR